MNTSMQDRLTVISAESLVEHFNQFKRKKLRKRDFTAERLALETRWAVDLNCIQYFSRSHEPAIAEFLAKQQAEHARAVQLLLGN
jgi:hypothetical protein